MEKAEEETEHCIQFRGKELRSFLCLCVSSVVFTVVFVLACFQLGRGERHAKR